MATQPEFFPLPDVIPPQVPPEAPADPEPQEEPFFEPPEVLPDMPDEDFPDRENLSMVDFLNKSVRQTMAKLAAFMSGRPS